MKKDEFYKIDPKTRSDAELPEPYLIETETGELVYVDFFENLPPNASHAVKP